VSIAVTKTGFGPASVAAKKPVPPTKPVPKVSPLGKAAAKRAKAVGGGPTANSPSPTEQHSASQRRNVLRVAGRI
jgi:hypothetical protein